MILDRGPAIVSRKTNTAQLGAMPVWQDVPFFESWYGELSFETSPARPTGVREETRTAARIRVLQNRKINEKDRVRLSDDPKEPTYQVRRAYHGFDEDNGEPITDLTLEVFTP